MLFFFFFLSKMLIRCLTIIQGTDTVTRETEFIEPAFFSGRPIYIVQRECRQHSTLTIPIQIATTTFQQGIKLLVHMERSSNLLFLNRYARAILLPHSSKVLNFLAFWRDHLIYLFQIDMQELCNKDTECCC